MTDLTRLVQAISQVTGDTPEDILSIRRNAPTPKGLWLLVAYLRHLRGHSWPETASILGRRSSSSLTRHLKKFDDLPVLEQISLLEQVHNILKE